MAALLRTQNEKEEGRAGQLQQQARGDNNGLLMFATNDIVSGTAICAAAARNARECASCSE